MASRERATNSRNSSRCRTSRQNSGVDLRKQRLIAGRKRSLNPSHSDLDLRPVKQSRKQELQKFFNLKPNADVDKQTKALKSIESQLSLLKKMMHDESNKSLLAVVQQMEGRKIKRTVSKGHITGRKPSPVHVRVSPERSISSEMRAKDAAAIDKQKAIVSHLEKQVELSRQRWVQSQNRNSDDSSVGSIEVAERRKTARQRKLNSRIGMNIHEKPKDSSAQKADAFHITFERRASLQEQIQQRQAPVPTLKPILKNQIKFKEQNKSQSPASKKSRSVKQAKTKKVNKIVKKSCRKHSSIQTKAKFEAWKKSVIDQERQKALQSMQAEIRRKNALKAEVHRDKSKPKSKSPLEKRREVFARYTKYQSPKRSPANGAIDMKAKIKQAFNTVQQSRSRSPKYKKKDLQTLVQKQKLRRDKFEKMRQIKKKVEHDRINSNLAKLEYDIAKMTSRDKSRPKEFGNERVLLSHRGTSKSRQRKQDYKGVHPVITKENLELDGTEVKSHKLQFEKHLKKKSRSRSRNPATQKQSRSRSKSPGRFKSRARGRLNSRSPPVIFSNKRSKSGSKSKSNSKERGYRVEPAVKIHNRLTMFEHSDQAFKQLPGNSVHVIGSAGSNDSPIRSLNIRPQNSISMSPKSKIQQLLESEERDVSLLDIFLVSVSKIQLWWRRHMSKQVRQRKVLAGSYLNQLAPIPSSRFNLASDELGHELQVSKIGSISSIAMTGAMRGSPPPNERHGRSKTPTRSPQKGSAILRQSESQTASHKLFETSIQSYDKPVSDLPELGYNVDAVEPEAAAPLQQQYNMDEFDLGSLRANEEDDILKETIESRESAIVRRISTLSPREESDRIDLPRSAMLEQVEEDRLWRVTGTPSDDGQKRELVSKPVSPVSKDMFLIAPELSISEIPMQAQAKPQDMFSGVVETQNQDLPRSFNAWRASIKPTEEVKRRREEAKIEMERLLADRKHAKNADMPRPFIEMDKSVVEKVAKNEERVRIDKSLADKEQQESHVLKKIEETVSLFERKPDSQINSEEAFETQQPIIDKVEAKADDEQMSDEGESRALVMKADEQILTLAKLQARESLVSANSALISANSESIARVEEQKALEQNSPVLLDDVKISLDRKRSSTISGASLDKEDRPLVSMLVKPPLPHTKTSPERTSLVVTPAPGSANPSKEQSQISEPGITNYVTAVKIDAGNPSLLADQNNTPASSSGENTQKSLQRLIYSKTQPLKAVMLGGRKPDEGSGGLTIEKQASKTQRIRRLVRRYDEPFVKKNLSLTQETDKTGKDTKNILADSIQQKLVSEVIDEELDTMFAGQISRPGMETMPTEIAERQAELQRELDELQAMTKVQLIAGIDTGLDTVDSYVEDIFAQIRQRGPQFLNAFLTPIFKDPLDQLDMMKQAQDKYRLEGTLGNYGHHFLEPTRMLGQSLCVLNMHLYLTLEKERESVIKEAIEQIKQQSEEQINESELGEMISEADHIHNKAIFDAVNEAMNLSRPYGINGEPAPWVNNYPVRNTHLISFLQSNNNLEAVFYALERVLTQVKSQVLSWASIRAGAIGDYGSPDLERMVSGEVRWKSVDNVIDDEVHMADRCGLGEEVISKSQQCWADPGENFNVQVKLELADALFDHLVGETVDILNNINK